MSLIKEELVTIRGNRARLTQVGGVLNRSRVRNLNSNQLRSLLTIPIRKHGLQYRLKRRKARKTRKFRKRRRRRTNRRQR